MMSGQTKIIDKDMRKIMKSVFAIVGILALASCSSTEEIFNEIVGDKSVKMTFTASQENGSATRTAIGKDGENTKILWSEGDKITVTNGTTPNDFILTAGQGTTKATFNGEITESNTYYAIYPKQGVNFSGNKFTGVVLKAEQDAVEGSFDKEAAIMVAKSNGTNLPFKNVAAYFKVTPAFDCSEIVVKANKSDEVLAGKFDVTIAEDGTPTVVNISEGSNTVKLKGTITAGKTYYIVLLPGTLSDGFTVTLKATNDVSYYKSRNSSYTVNRNDLCNLGELSTSNMIKIIPYITFSASAEQGLTLYNNPKLYAEGLQYSLNGGDWTNFEKSSTVTFGGTNGDLRLRAYNANGIYCERPDMEVTNGEIYRRYVFVFSNATPVDCSGDIRTLVNYENYENANTTNARFSGLFGELTALKSAPDLPITDLAEKCYEEMFSGCTSLASAPELPATTLSPYCYRFMFSKCTSLNVVPDLQASSLASNCCNRMFNGCTSLTAAPELPATSLADHCYAEMFYNCNSLTTPPTLPAETLAEFCYDGMFRNCTSLTTPPSIRATSLAKACYQYMFWGCTSLETAPGLPIKTLAEFCYCGMFEGCISLTTAPDLHATSLANSCYQRMFENCTNLSEVKMLAKDITAAYCLSSWLGDAGTGAATRTLTLANEDVYNTLVSNGTNWLPEIWKKEGGTTVNYQSQ